MFLVIPFRYVKHLIENSMVTWFTHRAGIEFEALIILMLG
jgi:hypothetical protein